MKIRGKLIFANALQKSVRLLRNAGLVEETKFPELLTPLTPVRTKRKNKQISWSYVVKIKVRSSFSPNELWLKFNRRASSIQISKDQEKWVYL
jgi:hypothetical protein